MVDIFDVCRGPTSDRPAFDDYPAHGGCDARGPKARLHSSRDVHLHNQIKDVAGVAEGYGRPY